MDRKGCRKKLDSNTILPPKIRTYEAVGDYLYSKVITKKIPKNVYRCTEGNDVIQDNVAVNLSRAKRDLHDAEIRLMAKRKYQAQRRKELDEKWEELARKEIELRESFIQFNEFIKENEHKRERALQQKENQEMVKWERSKQIYDLVNEYEELKQIKEMVEQKIEEYSIYKEYLDEVVEKNPAAFKDVLDLIMRYEDLKHARSTLFAKHKSDLDRLQVERFKLRQMVTGYRDKIESMQNKLIVFVQRHETARLNCLKWETIVKSIQNQSVKKMLEVYEVKTTSSNIYEQMCERMGHRPIYRDNVEMQLSCIRKGLGDLYAVNQKVRELREKQLLASQEATSSGSWQ